MSQHTINPSYITGFLQELLSIPSPSGYYTAIMKRIEEEARKFGFLFEMTPKGCGIITVQGRDTVGVSTTDSNTVSDNQATMNPRPRVIGLSAHVDTLGAMVRSIRDNGNLKLTSVGGFSMNSIENEYCQIHTRDGRTYTGTILTTHPSVHVYADAREMKREEAAMEVRLDEVVRSKQDTEQLGISVGDYISFDPRTVVLPSGFIKSRHLDDKASVAALFGMLEWFHREGIAPVHTLKLFISVYEEIGHGSSYIPTDITELIAVDMGCIGDDLSCTEQDVSICAKDSGGPYDYEMTSKLIGLAKRDGIPHAVDIYPYYSSDATAALRGGANIKAALIGPGVHASHAMERTHINAIMATVQLIAAYVME